MVFTIFVVCFAEVGIREDLVSFADGLESFVSGLVAGVFILVSLAGAQQGDAKEKMYRDELQLRVCGMLS